MQQCQIVEAEIDRIRAVSQDEVSETASIGCGGVAIDDRRRKRNQQPISDQTTGFQFMG